MCRVWGTDAGAHRRSDSRPPALVPNGAGKEGRFSRRRDLSLLLSSLVDSWERVRPLGVTSTSDTLSFPSRPPNVRPLGQFPLALPEGDRRRGGVGRREPGAGVLRGGGCSGEGQGCGAGAGRESGGSGAGDPGPVRGVTPRCSEAGHAGEGEGGRRGGKTPCPGAARRPGVWSTYGVSYRTSFVPQKGYSRGRSRPPTQWRGHAETTLWKTPRAWDF